MNIVILRIQQVADKLCPAPYLGAVAPNPHSPQHLTAHAIWEFVKRVRLTVSFMKKMSIDILAWSSRFTCAFILCWHLKQIHTQKCHPNIYQVVLANHVCGGRKDALLVVVCAPPISPTEKFPWDQSLATRRTPIKPASANPTGRLPRTTIMI